MKNFIDFVREQRVIGLAIGFILGGAVSKVVTSLVNDIINPIVGLLLGSVEGLKGASFDAFGAKLLLGDFASVIIDFLVVALVVYYGFKLLGLENLDKKKT